MQEMELYIHIPFCLRKCLYCDFLSGPYSAKEQEAYTSALMREIYYRSQALGNVPVSTIFIGGGTPSWLPVDLMQQIMDAVYDSFHIMPDAEITMEMNPGTVTADSLAAYHAMGINRVSLGLQSANDDELKVLGRIHDYAGFLKTYEMVRKEGFTNINIDIMTGLPRQTIEKLDNTLRKVTMLRPQHISCYSLIVEPGTPFAEKYAEDVHRRELGEPTRDLPDDDLEFALYDYARTFLVKQGYGQYEISNYAREGYECRHNIGYWKRTPYLGLGIGAASLLDSDVLLRHKDVNSRESMASDGMYADSDVAGQSMKTSNKSATAPEVTDSPVPSSARRGHYADLRFSNIRDLHDYVKATLQMMHDARSAESISPQKNPTCQMTGRDIDDRSENSAQQDKLRTVTNPPTVDTKSVQLLTQADAMAEFMFLGLRVTKGIRMQDFYDAFDTPIESVYGDIIERQKRQMLLREEDGRLMLTKVGTDVSNDVLCDYLLD